MEYCMLTVDFRVVTVYSTDQGEEDNWDTVGGATNRSLSPSPTIEETVPKMAQQATVTAEPRAPAKEWRPEPSATTGTM
jgi:hypothetical protein